MSQIGNDIVDLRDLWKRYEELNEELDTEAQEPEFDAGDWHEEITERDMLRELFEEVGAPFAGGEFDESTLILESYFERYAQDLAEELYEVADHWPFTCIDWSQAAEELKTDYTTYEIDGYTYW